jgi:hypothetical protein
VQDLRGFIKRLPPILGQPVDWELRKKLLALQELVGDSLPAREALESFPGYFAHSLHDRLIPRLQFVRRKGKRLDSAVLLRVALTGGDAAFAKDFVQCEPDEYEAFFAEYKQETKQQRAERNQRRRKQERQQSRHERQMQEAPGAGAVAAAAAAAAAGSRGGALWLEEAVCD